MAIFVQGLSPLRFRGRLPVKEVSRPIEDRVAPRDIGCKLTLLLEDGGGAIIVADQVSKVWENLKARGVSHLNEESLARCCTLVASCADQGEAIFV